MANEANANAAANYEDMGGDSAWDDTYGLGTVLAVELGLGKPKPLMGRLNNYGGGQCIFEPASKPGELYMWQSEVSEVDRITSPATLADIKQLISTGKISALKLETVVRPTTDVQKAHMTAHLAAL
ncbi:hypothetical protein C8A00DRAFT_44613 [Chaetomidium leptoderma]|uniref:Uncharacterized protein n=1 Tax=Chaetomidium leptoderma TaxID=669021 RepID=A0AAN6VJ96_9PEZI|nr:hypothetical protein C8A00DRAFT_44613 [Chaetomidium leptoderma]